MGGGGIGIFRRLSLAGESECSWSGLMRIVSLVSCPVSASLSTKKSPASPATGQTSPAATPSAPWWAVASIHEPNKSLLLAS